MVRCDCGNEIKSPYARLCEACRHKKLSECGKSSSKVIKLILKIRRADK